MTKELKYLLLIITIFTAAGIETDIYLPAFPDMMTYFGVSESVIQGLLTWNFVGICISCPFYGPLSDAFGRKKPLLVALSIFFLGSLLTLFAQDLNIMLLGRILQGLGSGGCFTLGMAVIFDVFSKEKAIQATNKLNTIFPIIMATAPMLGGYLNYHFGFRSNFMAIALIVLISLVISQLFFKETLEKEKRNPLKYASVSKDLKLALSNLAFWEVTLTISLLFAGYISFLSGTSVLFVIEFNMSKALFPWIQAVILGGWVAGSLLLNKGIHRFGIASVKRIGLFLTVIGSVILAASALWMPRDPILQTCAMVFYSFGANWIIGLYFPEGMEILPRIKGITASIMTSARLLISAIVVGLTSSYYNATIYPLAIAIVAVMLFVLPALLHYEKRARKSVLI